MEITGYKSGSQLIFERDGKKMTYDFKDMSFYRHTKKGLVKTENSQSFFKKVTVRDIASGFFDKSYAELMLLIDKVAYRYKNFASVFGLLEEHKHIEGYLLIGIKPTYATTFKFPVSQFSKEVLEFMKESQIEFTSNYWESQYNKYPKLVNDLCTYVRRNHYLDLEVYRMLYNMVVNTSRLENFRQLVAKHTEVFSENWNRVKNYGFSCEYKTLFSYLVRVERTEACNFQDALGYYKDYLNMMRQMEQGKEINRLRKLGITKTKDEIGFVSFGRIEKYPKYLRTRHDIVTRNFNVFSSEVDEWLFSQAVERGFAYSWGAYEIIVPKSSQDIKNEGVNLHHCVGSYVSKVMDKTTQIVFMRENKDESLVTVEIRAGSIVQAKGYNNRSTDEKEEKWLKTFARAKNLSYKDVVRDEKMPSPPVVALQKWDSYNATLVELGEWVKEAEKPLTHCRVAFYPEIY